MIGHELGRRIGVVALDLWGADAELLIVSASAPERVRLAGELKRKKGRSKGRKERRRKERMRERKKERKQTRACEQPQATPSIHL